MSLILELSFIDADNLTLVLWIGIVISTLLVGLAVTTIVRSVRIERRKTTKETLKPTVRAELFERLRRDTPEWEAWVNDLTTTEREVLRELLNTHLRLLDGSDRDRLQPLATSLAVDKWAIRTLKTGDRYAKLVALSWLALLDHPADPELIRRTCADDSALRAAGARVMLEQQYPNATEQGIRLLLDDPTEPLSAFGLDTLYELTQSQPDVLVRYAKTWHEDWTPALLVQVFRILQSAGLLNPNVSLQWIVKQCEHELPSVRAAAVRTLGDIGWRTELRSEVPIDDLTSDSSSEVRTAVYQTLGSWNDAEACQALARAARREQNPRCRLSAVRALYRYGCHDQLDTDVYRDFRELWSWVSATRTQVALTK
jgi:hypothetical protein